MIQMKLEYFTHHEEFPFFIQYGHHDDFMHLHAHQDFSELVCILEGSGIHHVNDESYFVKKGDVFVINSDTIHGYSKLKDFKICNIMFDYNDFFSTSLDIKKTAGFHSLFHIEPYFSKQSGSFRSLFDNKSTLSYSSSLPTSQSENINHFKSYLKLSLHDFDYVEKMIARMINEYEKKRIGYTTLLRSCFLELVVYITRIYEDQKLIEKDQNIQIAEVIAYMDTHFDTPLTVSELAKMASLSERHFSRIFTQTYGITPIRYINKLRLHKSTIMLCHTNQSITQIAFLCGFNDSNYFARQFKQLFEMSPYQYRKNKSVV